LRHDPRYVGDRAGAVKGLARIAVRPAVGVAVLALGVTGCGGASRGGRANGKALFASDCSACHSLAAAHAPALQGGGLRDLQVDRAAMLQFVTEMPAPRRLADSQVAAVADYVLAVERAARTR
jgi:mono/diheme cytochrome c family protein